MLPKQLRMNKYFVKTETSPVPRMEGTDVKAQVSAKIRWYIRILFYNDELRCEVSIDLDTHLV